MHRTHARLLTSHAAGCLLVRPHQVVSPLLLFPFAFFLFPVSFFVFRFSFFVFRFSFFLFSFFPTSPLLGHPSLIYELYSSRCNATRKEESVSTEQVLYILAGFPPLLNLNSGTEIGTYIHIYLLYLRYRSTPKNALSSRSAPFRVVSP